jgi:hypothetical protein
LERDYKRSYMVGRQLARVTKYIVKSSINIVGKKITQIIYSYFFLRVCECTVGVDVGDHPIDVDRYSVAMGGCTCIVLRGVVFPFFPFY